MAEENTGFAGEVSTAKHDMIILVDCHTGYCGREHRRIFCSCWYRSGRFRS